MLDKSMKRTHNAKKRNYNEFYTMYPQIKREIESKEEYRDALLMSKVICPCNDFNSQFRNYFVVNFNILRLYSLTCVEYTGKPDLISEPKKARIFRMWRDRGKVKQGYRYLKGNGDFKSKEVKELIYNADVIFTNPPFGRELVYFYNIAINSNKLFCFIGSNTFGKQAIPIKDYGKLWTTGSTHHSSFKFRTTDSVIERKREEKSRVVIDLDVQYIKNGLPVYKTYPCVSVNCLWYTNILKQEHHKEFAMSCVNNLYEEGSPEYPFIENSKEPCIAVLKRNKEGKLKGCADNIPINWDYNMLVPSSFLDNKFDPDYFELIGNGHTLSVEEKAVSDEVKSICLEKWGKVCYSVCLYVDETGEVHAAGANFGVRIRWKKDARKSLLDCLP